MSLITALKFIERLEREETLRTQLYVSRADDLPRLTQFAHGKGFVITEAELSQAIQTYKPKFKTGSIEPLKQLVSGK